MSTLLFKLSHRPITISIKPRVLASIKVTVATSKQTRFMSTNETGSGGARRSGRRGRGRGGRNGREQPARESSSTAAAAGDRGGKGRQSSGRGGRGRGRHQQHDQPTPRRRPLPAVRVYTSPTEATEEFTTATCNFAAFHARTQAARYKVHAPGCHCPKLRDILARGPDQLEFVTHDGHAAGDDAQEPERAVNGLIVLPHIKSIRSLYFCTRTDDQVYHANPLEAELKLKGEIFGHDNQQHDGNFKVSGAACLLDREPNGFACVSSTSSEFVEAVRDKARRATPTDPALRHADHAHHVLCLPQSALAQLQRAKTRHQTDQARDALLQHLASQGLPTAAILLDQAETQPEHIKLEHHLTSLLTLTQEHRHQKHKHNNHTNDDSAGAGDDDEMYWFVFAYEDIDKDKRQWTLDLPGGKRHLGETALEGAIRETQEETSLCWDASWVRDSLRGTRARNDHFNCYFLLNPPLPDILAG